MEKHKSSLVPRLAGLLFLAAIACVLFFVFRPKQPVPSGSSPNARWNRRITVTGDAGTQLRCWLNREGISEFRDLLVPTIVEIPLEVRSVEIRHTDAKGTMELKVEGPDGGSAAAALSAKDQFADLIISEHELLWSRNTAGQIETVSRLRLEH